jgi:sterile alpha motif and leucine zipper-containing kinase AZK
MEVDIEDLEFHEHAGGGAYGSVYKAFWKSRERIVAVKKLLSVDENELQVLSMLSHRNIVQFYCAVTKAPNFCLVTGTRFCLAWCILWVIRDFVL